MSELMDKIVNYITENNCNVYRVALMGDGFEPEFKTLVPANPCQDSYSMAKAFVVTAIGLLYDRGLLKTEDKVTDILAEFVPEGIDGRWHNITVDDALKHRMGLPQNFLDIDCFDANGFTDDYLDYMFRYPFMYEPCGEAHYTDGAYYLLSRVVEKLAGEGTDNLLWRELFAPLGFREAAWSHCPKGHVMGATGLYIRANDAVKLGELYRRGGVWNGKQIISKEWVDIVLSRGYELKPTGIGTSFGKGGMRGQMLAVFPDKGLSVAWHAYKFDGKSDLLQIIQDS